MMHKVLQRLLLTGKQAAPATNDVDTADQTYHVPKWSSLIQQFFIKMRASDRRKLKVIDIIYDASLKIELPKPPSQNFSTGRRPKRARQSK